MRDEAAHLVRVGVRAKVRVRVRVRVRVSPHRQRRGIGQPLQ